jgi:hypothetical protein
MGEAGLRQMYCGQLQMANQLARNSSPENGDPYLIGMCDAYAVIVECGLSRESMLDIHRGLEGRCHH